MIPRSHHDISRKHIDSNALKVLYRLNKAGFDAYLVGGCLRDVLLGLEPKDFDIATNAKPEQVKQLFNNCRLVGRRFRLAHILFQKEIIEVATLRGHHQTSSPHAKVNQAGRVLRDNVYGTLEEDAERRDFTVNAIYYSIADFSLHCLHQAVDDLNSRTLRLIGDPKQRYQEDPVRMLRAIRFATKLDMQIESKTAQPIKKMAPLLRDIHPSRMYDEVAKLFFAGHAQANLRMLQEFKLLEQVFPSLVTQFSAKKDTHIKQCLDLVCQQVDAQIDAQQRISHSLFYSQIFWYPMIEHVHEIKLESGMSHHDAMNIAINNIFECQTKFTAIPKRCTNIIREIWMLQGRLEKNKNNKAVKLSQAECFEKARVLLALRGQIEGGFVAKTSSWWDSYLKASPSKKKLLTQPKVKKRNSASSKNKTNHD